MSDVVDLSPVTRLIDGIEKQIWELTERFGRLERWCDALEKERREPAGAERFNEFCRRRDFPQRSAYDLIKKGLLKSVIIGERGRYILTQSYFDLLDRLDREQNQSGVKREYVNPPPRALRGKGADLDNGGGALGGDVVARAAARLLEAARMGRRRPGRPRKYPVTLSERT
jgi:hypothetical protein